MLAEGTEVLLRSRYRPGGGCILFRLRTFNLRIESLFRSSKIRQSPVRGFLGGRIDLIPHQIAIVREVCSRLAPRVLLADEVGLGKTIEAWVAIQREGSVI